jgi:hypothetical protein
LSCFGESRRLTDTSSYRKSLEKTSCFGESRRLTDTSSCKKNLENTNLCFRDSGRTRDRFSSQWRRLALGLASETGEEKETRLLCRCTFLRVWKTWFTPTPQNTQHSPKNNCWSKVFTYSKPLPTETPIHPPWSTSVLHKL